MAEPCKEFPIKKFGTVGVLSDSTDKNNLSLAQNIRGRPVGAITNGPIYQRLAGIGNSAFVDASYFALTYTPFGGSPRALVRVSDKTIAIEVACNGEHFVLLYSLNTHKARGLFYMGNDGTFNGTPDFVGGSATLSVLAVGLDDNARWHGAAYYGALHLGNGVDPNVVVQLDRATAPGKWRLAGSNQRPVAPVLRQIPPSGSVQVQASWTIPGTKRNSFDSNTYQPCTANISTDTFTSIAPQAMHGLVAGDKVYIQPGGLAGPSALTTYFVIASGLTLNQFKISATLGGSALNLSGAGTNIGYLAVGKVYAPGHRFVANDQVTLLTEVQLPEFHSGTPLAVATTYYIVNPAADQVGLAASSGGIPLLVDVAGVGLNQIVGIPASGHRVGPADLTFTADPRNFPGTIGDNLYVSISYQMAGYATGLTSTILGSGTVSDPYHYAIFTGPGFSSTAAIVAFVNGDTNVVGVLSAAGTVNDTEEDTQSWAFHELTGGVDGDTVNGVAVGFSDKTCSVYARFWDQGVDFLGYEGISSDKSNAVVINALSNFQLEVAVTPNPGVESGRFGFIRIYFQWGEDVAAQWNLAGEVPNTIDSVKVSTGGFNPITVNIVTDIFTAGVNTPNGLQVRILGNNTTYPAPLDGTTPYYVVNSTGHTFQLSLTAGGPPIDITTTGNFTVMTYFALQAITLVGHGYGNDDQVTVSANTDPADPWFGVLPSPLVAGNYYIVQATTTTFGLSTIINGSPVTFGNASADFFLTRSARRLVIGVDTPIGQAMQVDQHRPLPSTLTVFAGGNVWNGGVTEFPTRLYPSKQATETELFPEGANNIAYEIMRFPASVSGQKVTALYADDQNIYVHSPGAVVFFPPASADQKTFPRVFAGAVTESALTVWTKNRLQYLGANLELFEQIQSAITPLQSDFLALDAGAYVRSLTDLNAFATNPDRSFMFSDERGQALYYWVPGLSGNLIGFQYDQVAKGIMGPFTYPQVHSMVKLEVGRPEYIFVDEAGNLMVWDSSKQYDFDQILPTSSAPVVHTLGSGATTPSEAGFGQTPVPGGEYWRSSISSLETGYLDLNKPGVRKAFLGLLVTCVKNSRALLTFTATDKTGREVVRSYGDIYTKPIRDIAKVLVTLSDTAVKIRLDLVTAEMRPFVLRDLTTQWRMLQQM